MTPAIETQVIRNPIILPLGITDPAFKDSIKYGEELVDTGGAKIFFYMRPLLSRNPIINGEEGSPIWPHDEKKNNVEYQWLIGNVSTEGEFMAWWKYEKGGETFETLEFPLTFTDHGPGVGVKTGAILDGVGDYMPTTAHALANEPTFGERRMQRLAQLIQIKVTGTYVEPDSEESTYPFTLLEYFSKRVALELCTPGIDYWSRQKHTVTAQGPTEITAYPDMIASLEKLRVRLEDELVTDWNELRFQVTNLVQRKVVPMPSSSLEYEDGFGPSGEMTKRTCGPQPYITKNPNLTQKLYTGYKGFFDEIALGFYPFP